MRHRQPHLPLGPLGPGAHPAAADPRPRDVRRSDGGRQGRHDHPRRRPGGGRVARHLRQVLPVPHRQRPRLQELHDHGDRPGRFFRPVRAPSRAGLLEDVRGDSARVRLLARAARELGARGAYGGCFGAHAIGFRLRPDRAVRDRRGPDGRRQHDYRDRRQRLPPGAGPQGRRRPRLRSPADQSGDHSREDCR